MSVKIKKGLIPAAWLFYLVIGFEIVYMVSPFALYYYSSYGPSLNFLHQSQYTAWLSGFFLPHFVDTSSSILNYINEIGWVIIVIGMALLFIGAWQIYYAKFSKKGAVTGGLYKFIRHPQYVAFSIAGFGMVLAWPRFTVLIMYVTMFFLYYFLAKKEERECEQKFGETYKSYKNQTPMFIPGEVTVAEESRSGFLFWLRRFAANFKLYFAAIIVAIIAAFGLRNVSLNLISTHYGNDYAAIAAAEMEEQEIEQALRVAFADSLVQQKLTSAGFGNGAKLLVYVVPTNWYLADIPMETLPQNTGGHHKPKPFDREKFKLLFTKAKLSKCCDVSGDDILKNTIAREPIVLVKVNKSTGEVYSLETPPEHVLWGDIPTPLF